MECLICDKYLWCSVFKIMAMFYSSFLLGTHFIPGASAVTTMVASFYENPIIEGEEAMLHCDVRLPPTTEYAVSVLQGSTFLVRHDNIQPQSQLDMSLSSDGTALILKIANINRKDTGDYTCEVLTRSSLGAWRSLATDHTSLNVHFFPDRPRCLLQGMPNGVILKDRDHIAASCTTNLGNPTASIQWIKVTESGVRQILSTPRGRSSNSIFSDLDTTFSVSENNVQFICAVLASPSFPDPKDNTCTVGPFRAISTQAPDRPAGMPGGGGREDTTFSNPTSDHPDVRVGANPDLGAPTIIGIVIVLFVVILGSVLFFLVRFKSTRVTKQYPDTENIHMKGKETSIPIPHRQSPKFSFAKLSSRPFKTVVEVTPPPQGKFYPPPPAYPTTNKQQYSSDVMSMNSWSEIIDSPDGGCDQYGNDGDGLVSSKPSKTDSFKHMVSTYNSKSPKSNGLVYAMTDITRPNGRGRDVMRSAGRGRDVMGSAGADHSAIYATIN